MADAKEDKAGAIPTDLLSQFLQGLDQLPRVMVDGMLNQAENEDEKIVIRTLGEALQSQFQGLAGFIGERAGRLSPQQRQESEQVLRLASAGPLIASGSSLAGNLAPQVAKIGLAGIIREIKKIIRMLLDAFGIKLPKWFDVLLTLIDELVNLFFSTGSPSLAGTLSSMERDHLDELTATVRLQRENELRAERSDDENT